jgi:hypothetical protein
MEIWVGNAIVTTCFVSSRVLTLALFLNHSGAFGLPLRRTIHISSSASARSGAFPLLLSPSRSSGL